MEACDTLSFYVYVIKYVVDRLVPQEEDGTRR